MKLDPSQERAVELILSAHVGIVTGGPGTGKTTSLRTALDRLDERGVRYVLASPTGKASRRMMEATGRSASTVHRLLEWYAPERRFLRDAEDPLDVDLVVIDESSMLDVELARSLLAAVQGETRLVLIGDGDQLPSVGPGRVFADLIESGRVPVARLTTLHRAAQESWVCSQAARILAGQVPELTDRADFIFVDRAGRDDAAAALLEVVVDTLPRRGIAQEAIQVLVPQNVGPAGSELFNGRLQARLNPPHEGAPSWKLGGDRARVGDRVIQTQNAYLLDHGNGVMNGEVGTVQRIGDGDLDVRFDDGRVVTYDPDAATKLRLAYALTVHKSQGSEWPWVVVFCHSTHTHMLSRNLVYTAITRAKKGVVIVGDRKGIEAAVKNARDAKRNTGLVERLREGEEGRAA